MLNKKKQVKYLHKRSKSLLTNFDHFLISLSSESLHGLRVDIKKIKAVVLFSDDCLKSEIIEDFKGLKKVFKAAGLIRSAWIHIEMMKKNGVKDISLYNQNEKEFIDHTFEFMMVSDYY